MAHYFLACIVTLTSLLTILSCHVISFAPVFAQALEYFVLCLPSPSTAKQSKKSTLAFCKHKISCLKYKTVLCSATRPASWPNRQQPPGNGWRPARRRGTPAPMEPPPLRPNGHRLPRALQRRADRTAGRAFRQHTPGTARAPLPSAAAEEGTERGCQRRLRRPGPSR